VFDLKKLLSTALAVPVAEAHSEKRISVSSAQNPFEQTNHKKTIQQDNMGNMC
jgi:hypothetical protein